MRSFGVRSTLHNLAASLAMCAFFTVRGYSGEPAYEGKTLTEWLDAYYKAPFQSNAVENAQAALHSIGTNAIPYLLDWGGNTNWSLQRRSIIGFHALGSAAAPAIPALAERLTRPDEQLSVTAARSLNSIGDAALPALVYYLTNHDGQTTTWAVQSIELSPKARYIIPLLLRDADSSNPVLRWRAAQALGCLHLDAYRVLPTLKKLLADKEPAVRFAALYALERYGAFGTSAVPAISTLLTNQDMSCRMQATNTLEAISNATALIRSQAHQ